jgi:hypothetical protein
MRQTCRGDAELITCRLVAIGRDLDRRLDQLLAARGLSRGAFFTLGQLARELPADRVAAARAALQRALPPLPPQWAGVDRPAQQTLARSGRRLLPV